MPIIKALTYFQRQGETISIAILVLTVMISTCFSIDVFSFPFEPLPPCDTVRTGSSDVAPKTGKSAKMAAPSSEQHQRGRETEKTERERETRPQQ